MSGYEVPLGLCGQTPEVWGASMNTRRSVRTCLLRSRWETIVGDGKLVRCGRQTMEFVIEQCVPTFPMSHLKYEARQHGLAGIAPVLVGRGLLSSSLTGPQG